MNVNKGVPPSPGCGMCIDSSQEPILIAAVPPSSNPAYQCLVKKNMEYREIATKMFFFYKKTNIKLLGNYPQKNSKGYSLSTIRINNIRRWCSKFITLQEFTKTI